MMQATAAQRLQYPTWIDSKRIDGRKHCSLPVSQRLGNRKRFQAVFAANLHHDRTSTSRKSISLVVSCSTENSSASVLESEGFHAPFDDAVILKNKAEDVKPYLNGRSVFVVGIMGSGKTTVGKIMSEALNYSFFDCDTLIEQNMNGTSVAEIFKLYGEAFFREKETEVLRNLSVVRQLVVSTGGGAVIEPMNWEYMQNGITVWLDVPLEALAQRIAAVGTDSRPLLHHESGDAYTKAYQRLSTILEERGEAYAKAHARVSLENIAAKLGNRDVLSITPTVIVIEALEQIKGFLKGKHDGIAEM